MFTHLTEYNIKLESRDLLLNYFEKQAVPVLKKTPGFMDVVLIQDEDVPTKFISVGFWTTKELCVKFFNEQHPKLVEPIREHLTMAPMFRHLKVEFTTLHKVAAEAA